MRVSVCVSYTIGMFLAPNVAVGVFGVFVGLGVYVLYSSNSDTDKVDIKSMEFKMSSAIGGVAGLVLKPLEEYGLMAGRCGALRESSWEITAEYAANPQFGANADLL